MDGWTEWVIYTLLMVLVGAAFLVFFTNPLLSLIAAAASALAYWASSPITKRNGR